MIFILALATSIDALAIGITFSMLNVAIFYPAIIIGIITFIAAVSGIFIGKKMAHFFENKFELIGGAVLILIGCKILIERLGLI
ncbi:MAG: manganese efflux pump [Elusimicrobiota bacterium]|nr:manganese efflux pump [Elusimicrobiota bacterium]